MNKIMSFLALFALVLSSQAPVARASIEGTLLGDFGLQGVTALDIINWKPGDTMVYDVSMRGFALGTNTKSVTKDEGTAIWLRQEMKLMTQNEVVDALISKADGKVLKLIRNGQEQQIPDEQLEIISQDATEIRVKAGTFQVIHIVAKTRSVPRLEVWVNPRDTAIDGTVKQVMQTQVGEVTMELTRFTRMP